MSNKIKIGKYYKSRITDLIVKAIEGEIRSITFSGVVIEKGDSDYVVGSISNDWNINVFEEFNYVESNIELFPIF